MPRTSLSRYRRLLVTMLLLLCWSGFGAAAMAADAPQHVKVELGDYRFTPDQLEIRAGVPTVLELVNTDWIAPHTFTIGDTIGNLVINQNVPGGQTVTVELPAMEPGSYTFYCTKKLPLMKSHREKGMEGTLTVTEP